MRRLVWNITEIQVLIATLGSIAAPLNPHAPIMYQTPLFRDPSFQPVPVFGGEYENAPIEATGQSLQSIFTFGRHVALPKGY